MTPLFVHFPGDFSSLLRSICAYSWANPSDWSAALLVPPSSSPPPPLRPPLPSPSSQKLVSTTTKRAWKRRARSSISYAQTLSPLAHTGTAAAGGGGRRRRAAGGGPFIFIFPRGLRGPTSKEKRRSFLEERREMQRMKGNMFKGISSFPFYIHLNPKIFLLFFFFFFFKNSL